MLHSSELVTHLQRAGVLKTPALIESFRQVDRKDFMPASLAELAYEDRPFPIGHAQTISQPYTVAFMLELLNLRSSDAVLDIGSGSGWTTALMAKMVRSVVGVERIAELVTFARSNLAKYDLPNARIESAGDRLGLPGERFDKILVSAAAEILPESLFDQLNPGGVLVIPVGHAICRVAKSESGEISKVSFEGFVFVPLII